MTDDERAIRDAVARWMEATRGGDVDAVLRLMTDDVVFLVAGQAPFGKDAFAAASRGMGGARVDGKSELEEVVVCGDCAYTRSHLSIEVALPNGKTMRRAGHAMSVFRKQADGRWLLARDANLTAAVEG